MRPLKTSLKQLAYKLGWTSPDQGEAKNKPSDRLMKDRPISMEERFVLTRGAGTPERFFQNLLQGIRNLKYRDQDRRSTEVIPGQINLHLETGTFESGTNYIYIKQPNEQGILIESTPTGWITSHADKINQQECFIRKGDPIDVCQIFEDQLNTYRPRVKSPWMNGHSLMNFNLYKKEFLRKLVHDENLH